MPCFVCEACGTQFADADLPPAVCPICADERQPLRDQRWTTLDELRRGHRGDVRDCEPGLVGIGCEPSFAIGQRALLVRSPDGNVLWDCITLLDDDLAARVEALGGIATIAISLPHYSSAMVEWARAFDARVLVHADDGRWIVRRDPSLEPWTGETLRLGEGLTLLRLGGHFEGGAALHWAGGADGRGALLSGDIVQVVPDPGWVSFMYSYPNLIPLPAAEVQRIAATLEPWEFDRIYGAWWDRVIQTGGKDAVRRSAERYVAALGGAPPPPE